MKRINQETENLFVFCPGNGTRYKLFAAKIQPDHRGAYDLIVAWLKRDDMGGPSTLMSTQNGMYYAYFMEKMGMKNVPDAIAIMCFMREQFGAKVELPHDSEQLSWVLAGRKESL